MKKPIILTIILFTVQFLAPIFGQTELKPELVVQTGHSSSVSSVAFSPDGKTLVSGSDDSTIKLWNVETGQEIKSLERNTSFVYSVAFSPDGKTLASGSFDKTIKLWNVETGQEIKSLRGHTHWVHSVAFSADGKTLASGSLDGTIKFWNKDNDRPLGSLTFLDKEDWVVTTPDGRLDTNKLENPQGLHWIMPDAPFTPLSFEVFMRDYYEPNLLPRLLKCTEEGNCDKEFKPVRNLTALNRTQPKVKITDIKPIDADTVQVTIETEDEASEYEKDKQNQPLHSGVFDVRLFRDGQLVGYSTADEKLQNTFRTYANFDEELKVWQEANKVDLVNGKKTFTFQVKLPKNSSAKEFEFSSYAFNLDRVKSETARETYQPPTTLPTAKGNAYIVTIGVNASETERLKLNYAANDARRMQDELAKNLPKDKYEKIVQIPLISDYDKDGNLSENNATKAKIKSVLDKLSGKPVSADALKDVPNAELLKKVSPEDLVLLAFSGHGYADQNGIFYLIPYDIGKVTDGLKSVLPKSISSDELSLWLRDIDAGEMMMIVDACHSAAAVQGAGFKPGPMGSRGLGQLSYDKGMRILTATQADNVALEMGKLQHGLLTYSLVKNGIMEKLADYQPKDNSILSNEWLSFTIKDVPNIYGKLERGELKELLVDGVKPKDGVEVILEGQKPKSNLNLQQPTLFDFGKRERQYELLNLLKKGGN